MYLSIKNKGVKEAFENIERYDRETKTKITKRVNNSLNAIRRLAKKRINNRTGNLSKGIRKNFDSRVISGVVMSRAPHAHLVEFGTKGKGIVSVEKNGKGSKAFKMANGIFRASFVHKGTKAKPYLFPSFNEVRPKFYKGLVKDLKK